MDIVDLPNSRYHCLDCGTSLKNTNVSENSDTYYCTECEKRWFRTIHITIEWTVAKRG